MTKTNFVKAVISDVEFDVSFTVSSFEPNILYYSRAIGGEELQEVYTWSSKTSDFLAWNGSWASMPEFTTNNEGSASATIKAKFKRELAEGPKQFSIRVRKANVTPNYDSDAGVIIVTTPPPTSSPTPTPTSTPTPTPTPTATSTSTTTKTPAPTKTQTPTTKKTTTPIAEATHNEETVLGLRNVLITDSPTPTLIAGEEKKKFPIGAAVLIVLGMALVGGSGFVLFKKMREDNIIKKETGNDEQIH